ncbi:inovirus-type Gp2 protein [Lentisphaerota bacterium WC36G]
MKRFNNENSNRPSNNDNYELNKDYSSKIKRLLYSCINKHNKVFLVRFDVRYPTSYANINIESNSLICNFNESLNRYLKRNNYDPRCIWVREQHESSNPHYHFAILLNGNKIQRPHKVISKAESLWNRQLGLDFDNKGLIEYCNKVSCGMMIYRDREETHRNALNWVSYLAKVYSKNINTRFRSIGMSRI